MKRLSLLLFLLSIASCSILIAQDVVPRTISVQGVLTDASGVLAPDGPHILTLRIYESASAGTPLFSETHTVVTVRGVFSALLGSSLPEGLPITLPFNQAHWLGIVVDSGAELSPRTPFTAAPYALFASHAAIADSLRSSGSTVRSLNGMSGSLYIVGSAGTQISSSNDSLTISSRGFAVPYSVSAASSSVLFALMQTGGGEAANFSLVNITSAANALHVSSNGTAAVARFVNDGTGGAALLQVTSATNNANALVVTSVGGGDVLNVSTLGSGRAGSFVISNPLNNSPSLAGSTSGGGAAVNGMTGGLGKAGNFFNTNAANPSNILEGMTNGTGAAISGIQTGTGKGGNIAITNPSNTSAALNISTIGSGPVLSATGAIAQNGGSILFGGGIGSTPASGAGTRMMWIPAKAAFRAGIVSGSAWDDSNVGSNSIALGNNAVAGGNSSVSLGALTTASGDYSIALGSNATTSGLSGTFVFGDNSTSAVVANTAANQFTVRAAGGTLIYSNSALSSGVSLAAGGGSWSSVSDRRKKENFDSLNGEEVLSKLERVPVTTWNYRSQPRSIRHIGPMAQDFSAAFGVGESDTTITDVDINGVNMAAVKALIARTEKLARENEALRARVDALEEAARKNARSSPLYIPRRASTLVPQ